MDVFELSGAATKGNFRLLITKDSKVSLSMPSSATLVGNRTVQNSLWTLDNSMPNYYSLTSSQPIDANGLRSVGLLGELKPGATQGVLNLSAVIIGLPREAVLTNNGDADKIEYFQQ
ncbi:hypothetical protein [Spirosoma validum]|uniref:Uncharacterized protein n=1 Tax=Spirosoma validum TaxID=2771355 RepID=A0A927B0F8_9BACT|nr:hypothetical protein [Spirosoma validum]MBD2752987.1 hypothetical protein [Spirosoma validum]